jgi:hypothetical protein
LSGIPRDITALFQTRVPREREYRSCANDEFIHTRHSACGLDESAFAPLVADYVGPPLVRLPPSPFRSLGGYFSYWGGLNSSVSWIWMRLAMSGAREPSTLQGERIATALGRRAIRIVEPA